MKEKKVLVIASYADSVVSFRGPLLAEFVRNHCVTYVAAPGLASNKDVNRRLIDMGVIPQDLEISRAGLNPFVDLLCLIRLCKLISIVKPDVVLAYTAKPVIYGLLTATIKRVPFRFALITGLGFAFTDGNKDIVRRVVGIITHVFYRVSLSMATCVFFQNPDDMQLFYDRRIVSGKVPSIVLNGSGVDLGEFKSVPLPSTLSFLMIARLIGDKGVREYANAARAIKLKHPSVNFHLVGWIDDNPNSIAEHELEFWVGSGLVFHGKLVDVKPIISSTSVYVLPSYREGTPRTVLEAMAMGRPIITTDAPGCRETVVDGYNGFLVQVKSTKALAEAMLKFIEKPELIPTMGARSRKIAEEKYDVNKVNSVMLSAMGITSGRNDENCNPSVLE